MIYVLDESNGIPLAWLANRSALVSLSLGFWSLFFYIKWRREGLRFAAHLSTLLFATALLAGEWTFTVFAYLFAFELFGVKDSHLNRLRALAPAVLLSLIFILLQRLLNYGSFASDSCFDPFSDPFQYLRIAVQRIPIFLAELIFGINSLWWMTGAPWRRFFLEKEIFSHTVWQHLPDWQSWHYLIGMVALICGIVLFRWVHCTRRNGVSFELRWLLVGSLLSLFPMVAPFPHSRSLLPACMGVSAAWSTILLLGIGFLYHSIKRKASMRFIAVLVLLLGVLHIQLVSAAMRSAAEISIVADHTRTIRRYIERAEINDSIVSNQRVFLINTTNHSVAAFLPYIRFFLNHPLPRSYHTLSAADHPHEVRRLAANVLELSTLGGSFFTSEMEIFLRPSRYPFRKGDIVRHSQFTVEIKQLLNGKPLRISFSFNKSLDDAVDGVVPPEKRSQGVFETASSLLRVTFTPPIHSRWKSPLTSFSQID